MLHTPGMRHSLPHPLSALNGLLHALAQMPIFISVGPASVKVSFCRRCATPRPRCGLSRRRILMAMPWQRVHFLALHGKV